MSQALDEGEHDEVAALVLNGLQAVVQHPRLACGGQLLQRIEINVGGVRHLDTNHLPPGPPGPPCSVQRPIADEAQQPTLRAAMSGLNRSVLRQTCSMASCRTSSASVCWRVIRSATPYSHADSVS